MKQSELRAVRDELLQSIDRWAPEVISAPPRSTLRFGIAQKCYTYIDSVIEICTFESIQICGSEGANALAVCGNGKPFDRLTMGQRVQILEMLDSCLGERLHNAGTIVRNRALGPKGLVLLHRISKARNRFTHDATEIAPSDVVGLLGRANELCESALIDGIITMQSQRHRQERPHP